MKFTDLAYEKGIYTYTNIRNFEAEGFIRTEDVERCFEFAYGMTFGGIGEHKPNGRTEGEIFVNALQGKIAEWALYRLLTNNGIEIKAPDESMSKRGEWDSFDLMCNDHYISVKSTKSFGELLLLETKDFDEDGLYIPNRIAGRISQYDHIVLIRVAHNGEDKLYDYILSEVNPEKNELKNRIMNIKWEYDIPGYINAEDFRWIIENEKILLQGDRLGSNESGIVKNDNYYCQTGDLRPEIELIESLKSIGYEKFIAKSITEDIKMDAIKPIEIKPSGSIGCDNSDMEESEKFDSIAREEIIKSLDKNVFVEAGAGSGKTTAMIRRMVALIENGMDISSICAITFTKASATDFKKKFKHLLIMRSSNPIVENMSSADISREQAIDTLGPVTEESKQRCDNAFNRFDEAYMGTIDSLCNKLVLFSEKNRINKVKIKYISEKNINKIIDSLINEDTYDAPNMELRYCSDVRETVKAIINVLVQNLGIRYSLTGNKMDQICDISLDDYKSYITNTFVVEKNSEEKSEDRMYFGGEENVYIDVDTFKYKKALSNQTGVSLLMEKLSISKDSLNKKDWDSFEQIILRGVIGYTYQYKSYKTPQYLGGFHKNSNEKNSNEERISVLKIIHDYLDETIILYEVNNKSYDVISEKVANQYNERKDYFLEKINCMLDQCNKGRADDDLNGYYRNYFNLSDIINAIEFCLEIHELFNNLEIKQSYESFAIYKYVGKILITKGKKGFCEDITFSFLMEIANVLRFIQYHHMMSFVKKILGRIETKISTEDMEESKNGEQIISGTYTDILFMARNKLYGDENANNELVHKFPYKCFFVDELQDTNPLQMQIIMALASEQRKECWKDVKPQGGSLFLIGDPKQSIYRFRGAEVRTYLDTKKLFKSLDFAKVLELTRNNRSNKQLCDYFNNRFPQIILESESQCRYSLIPTAGKDDTKTSVFKYSAEYKYNKGEPAKEHVKSMTARIVYNYLKDHPSSFGDIMILTRNNYQARDIISYLQSNGLYSPNTNRRVDDSCILVSTIHQAKGLDRPVVILYGSRKKEYDLTSIVEWKASDANLNENPYVHIISVPKRKKAFDDFEECYLKIKAWPELCEKETILQQEQEMRLLYVAATRPEKELYICETKWRNNVDSIWEPLL